MSTLPVTPNLGLALPPLHYSPYPVPLNENFTLVDAFAGTVVSLAPEASQTIVQPAGTYLNLQRPLIFGAMASVLFGGAANGFDSAFTRVGPGAFTLDAGNAGAGEGKLKLTQVNALQGFQVNGLAPLNHILVGDGNNYVDSATLPPGLASYQTVESNAAALPPQPSLNFLPGFSVTDNGGNDSTDVGLAPTGVDAGSYSNPRITISADGRITAAAAAGITQTQPARALGTTYVAAKTVTVTVVGHQGDAQGGALAAYTGQGVANIQVDASSSPAGAVGYANVHFIVPAGYSFKVTTDRLDLFAWTEWG